ncbi:nucleoporin Nup84p [[Candida] anglica]
MTIDSSVVFGVRNPLNGGVPTPTTATTTSSVVQQFASALQEYQLASSSGDPFEIINNFKAISAGEALKYGEASISNPSDEYIKETFETYDLETKMWHLVYILYSYRMGKDNEKLLPNYKFSSEDVKRHNFLYENRKIREVSLIINWLQENTKSVDTKQLATGSKWQATKSELANQSLNVLASNGSRSSTLKELDSDGPLRNNQQSLHPDDESADSQNFQLIYRLVLSNQIDDAVEVANNTGNFTLSLILLGAVHNYVDPVVDQQAFAQGEEEGMILEQDEELLNNDAPSGQKHKYLWRQTVYKLSQQTNINTYERLIYSYLCGGDVDANIKEAKGNWEEILLVYLNQLYVHKMGEFIISNLEKEGISNKETLAVSIPSPQNDGVDDILNVIQRNSNSIASEESRHPFRLICGGIMVEQVSTLLHNIIKQLSVEQQNSYIIRVVTHLSIFSLIIGGEDVIKSKDITKVISLYIAYLSTIKKEELIPSYLAYIPNESDARECYSLFLSSLTDPKERAKQIEISRQFFEPLGNEVGDVEMDIGVDDSTSSTSGDYEGKMVNVLRRTVERVMVETASHYAPNTSGISTDEEVDEIDFKLYRAVEWFYENKMYEDAISATITIIRRFLLCGKLNALKQFGKEKNFKQLIKDYDFDVNTKMFSSSSASTSVTEEDKEELIQYEVFIQGLALIDDWKKFLEESQINGAQTSKNLSFWKVPHVGNSIEKISSTLGKLTFNWFSRLISQDYSENVALFKEFRSIYIPYLVMELLQIYQYSRLNDWKYMRSAFRLINDIADDESNDLLTCFVNSGRLNEVLQKSGEIAAVASEIGIGGIFF